jgi:hypothetical protein
MPAFPKRSRRCEILVSEAGSTPVSSGESGGVKVGGGGAYQKQFTNRMFLPMPAEQPIAPDAPPAPVVLMAGQAPMALPPPVDPLAPPPPPVDPVAPPPPPVDPLAPPVDPVAPPPPPVDPLAPPVDPPAPPPPPVDPLPPPPPPVEIGVPA